MTLGCHGRPGGARKKARNLQLMVEITRLFCLLNGFYAREWNIGLPANAKVLLRAEFLSDVKSLPSISRQPLPGSSPGVYVLDVALIMDILGYCINIARSKVVLTTLLGQRL